MTTKKEQKKSAIREYLSEDRLTDKEIIAVMGISEAHFYRLKKEVLQERCEIKKLPSFKEFIFNRNIDFIEEEIALSEDVSTVEGRYKRISMTEIGKDEDGMQRFKLSLETRKGAKYAFELRSCDLLSPSLIKSLMTLSAN